LAAGAPEGLCRVCLLKMGLESNTLAPTDAELLGRWTPPESADLATSFPDLEIMELLGRGGMGAVYKARQKSLDRLVALKILPPEVGQDADFTERFAREAQAMARLNHPHIVAIHDFGQSNALFFFVMEYVDGLNLRQLLNAERMAPREALAIVPQICDALQYAHDQGIVHRDIKPENILLNRRGQVKIADFGLAKLVGVDSTTGATERVVGTPQYMAPEQIERPAEVDHRADIYSLGVVFYQMLTGELPAKRMEPPSKKVVIDVRLDEVVLRALEKDPQRRYQQVSEVKTQMETIASNPSKADDAPYVGLRAPLKSSRGGYSTPEYMATAYGGFVWRKGTGELALYDDRLVFTEGWQRTEIPFTSLQALGVARGPRWISPLGHQFLSVIYDEKGQRKTLLFMPGTLWFRTAGDTKRYAAEWIIAIREAVKAATGIDLSYSMDRPTVVPSSPWGALLVITPLWLISVILVSAIWHRGTGHQDRGRTVIPPISKPLGVPEGSKPSLMPESSKPLQR
jgi:predicted Ser/Thr protein kinase